MKKHLKILALLFLTFLTFSSCEKDLYENTLQQKNDIKFKTIRFGELAKLNPKIAKTIINLQTSQNVSSESKNIYGFEVDTTNIVYLEQQNGYKSYSFKIEQPLGQNYFKNIVICDFPNGEDKIVMTKFNLSKTLEQTKTDNSIKQSITSTEVIKFNSQSSGFDVGGCVQVGYYDEIDRCEGELVTPGERPDCFNADGTRATKSVFRLVAANCGTGSGTGGIPVGSPGNTGNSGNMGTPNPSGSNTGGGNDYSGIFIPNPYEGDPDLDDPDAMLTAQVSYFLTSFSNTNTVVKNLLTTNTWLFANTVQFVKNNGGLSQPNKNTITNALVKVAPIFNLFLPNSTEAEINILRYKAFNFLLTNPTVNLNDFIAFLTVNNNAQGVALANNIFNYLASNPQQSDAATTELFFKVLAETNNLQNDVSETFILNNASYFSQEVQDQMQIDPFLVVEIARQYIIQRAVKKYFHKDWNEIQIYYSILWDFKHTALDAFGLIPVFGEIADLANGVLYVVEGDGINASLSFASAVPVVGWASTATKYAIKVTNTVQTASFVSTKVLLSWKKVGNLIDFGASNQLRKVLGIADGAAFQAHHIIPWALKENPVVQKAAKSNQAFHMNEALNGIPLSTSIHMGSHPSYSGKIFQKLEAFRLANPNATPDQCYNEVADIINDVRTAIANNPTTHINQLNF